MNNPFESVSRFESAVAEYFGAKFGVATDSCTHAIELALRLISPDCKISCPNHTYISIPFTFLKLGLQWEFDDRKWEESYNILNTPIIDGAVQWAENSYQSGTFLCLSFQYRKHLAIGRGGMILTDSKADASVLKKMSYDGRDLSLPWADQDISSVGYHYYMTPESAEIGLAKLPDAIQTPPKKWSYKDYPDLSKMSVFKKC